MTEMIERIGQAMAEKAGLIWALLPEGHDMVCGHGMPEGCKDYWRTLTRVAIQALDTFRAAEKRRNCKHHNRYGTGCTGIDGSGWSTWFCQECGASYDSRASSALSSKPLGGE